MERKNMNWKKRKLFGSMFMLLLLFVLPFIIMSLWNAILPDVFNATTITYWQALGLFILSRILFGGFRCGGPGRGSRRRFGRAGIKEKFMNMTDDEKVAFKQRWKDRCRNNKNC